MCPKASCFNSDNTPPPLLHSPSLFIMIFVQPLYPFSRAFCIVYSEEEGPNRCCDASGENGLFPRRTGLRISISGRAITYSISGNVGPSSYNGLTITAQKPRYSPPMSRLKFG